MLATKLCDEFAKENNFKFSRALLSNFDGKAIFEFKSEIKNLS